MIHRERQLSAAHRPWQGSPSDAGAHTRLGRDSASESPGVPTQGGRAQLKIALAPSISASLVLDPIAEIAKFVPGLHVELREGPAEKLVELLLEGEINAAMVGDVQDMPARIDDWSLFEERYVAVLAQTHRLANRPSIGIDDLRETVLLERAG